MLDTYKPSFHGCRSAFDKPQASLKQVKYLLKQAKPLSPSTKDEAYRLQRRAQFFLDFVEAENSMGFHAPGEALRVLGLSIDASRKGQNLIRSHVKK